MQTPDFTKGVVLRRQMSDQRTYFTSKRGQISLFIAIAVIALIIITTFFLARENIAKLNTGDAVRVSDYAQVAVVQEYVTSCLEELSEDALVIAGQQGGYTDLSTVDAFTSYYGATESDGFLLHENSQIGIPYWHYLLSDNDCGGDCLFYSQRPRLEGATARSVEQQVKTYINREMTECLQDFVPFKEQGYDISLTDNAVASIDPIDGIQYPFELEVLFRENDVKVQMDYPLTIAQGDVSDTITTYSVVHDIPFKRMFTLASVLTAMELEYRYLEAQSIELISLNSGIDNAKLPPLGGASNEFVSTTFWTVPDVQEKLQQMLLVYTNAMRVEGTKNYRDITFPDSPAKPALDAAFANMVVKLNDEDHLFGDITVNYDYMNWPWYFHINSNGVLIEPDSLSIDFFPFFGIQRYRHYYDISNPVRVALHNDGARDGAGFSFAFGLENNVRNNEPMRESYADYDVTLDVGSQLEEVQETLVCNPDQRNTEEVTITVKDKNTNEPLENSAVSFVCGDESCPLGITDSNGEYVGKLPICGGAHILATHLDTISGTALVSTSLDFDEDQTIELETLVDVPVSIKKALIVKEYDKPFASWSFSRFTNLDIKERAVVSIFRVEENPAVQQYTTSVVLDGSDGPDAVNTIRIAPGTYEVQIQAILDEEVYIPPSFRSADGTSYTIDAVDMKQFPSGTVELNEKTQYWTITSDEVYDPKTEIQFYYPGSDLVNVPQEYRVVEDMQKAQDIATKLIEQNSSLFIPKIIK